MLEIRTFRETDRSDLLELFGRASKGSPSSSLWGHEASEAAVYLTPYMDLEPDSLFLAFEDGTMSGYLTGCLDTSRFPAESERIGRAFRDYRLAFRPRPVRFITRSVYDVARAALFRDRQMDDFRYASLSGASPGRWAFTRRAWFG